MRISKTGLIIFFLGVLFKSYGYMNVYPYRVYLDIEQNVRTQEVIFYNKTLKPLRYKFTIKDESLKKVISFYPQVITVNSGEEKSIKLKLEDNWKAFEPKEYSTEVMIEQLRVPLKNSKGEFIQGEGVEVYPKLAIPLKIYFGNTRVSLKKEGKTILKNISGRELSFEIYHRKRRKDKNNPLGFIKSVRLKNNEQIDILEYIEKYRREQNLSEQDRLGIDNLEIYEKFSNKLVEIN